MEAHEDLAVGEVARGLRGDVHVEFFGYLLGQLRMRAAREEHQILAVVGPVVAHVPPSPVRIGWIPPIVSSPLNGSLLNTRLRIARSLPVDVKSALGAG